jgi:hypothetical protein
MRTAAGNENGGWVRGWRARINGESMSRAGVEGMSRAGVEGMSRAGVEESALVRAFSRGQKCIKIARIQSVNDLKRCT